MAKPLFEPVFDDFEPIPESKVEPNLDPVEEVMVEPPVDDPSVDPVREPVPEIVEPETENTEEPKLEPSVKPVCDPVVDPVLEPIFDPIEEPVGAWSILESDSSPICDSVCEGVSSFPVCNAFLLLLQVFEALLQPFLLLVFYHYNNPFIS